MQAAVRQIILFGGKSSYLGQVTTRAYVPISFNAGFTQANTRTRHIARDKLSVFQIVIPNWYVSVSTWAETATGGTATVTAAIEYPAGVFKQVKFGGSASGTIASGANLISDPIQASIPKGTAFFVRLFWTNASGIIFRGCLDIDNGEGFDYVASGASDLTMGGTVIQKDVNNTFPPIAIIAMTKLPSVYLCGDSRVGGFKDSYSGQASGDIGELARPIGPSLAYINGGVTGDTAQLFAANATKRAAIAQYCSHVVCQLGINDLIASRTTAQILANHATIRGLLKKPMFQATLPPQSSSTDSWATTANQTTAALNAERLTFNNTIRTGGGGGIGYFEIADAVESARDSGKWVVTGAANYATADGLHESQAANLLIQASGNVNPARIRR